MLLSKFLKAFTSSFFLFRGSFFNDKDYLLVSSAITYYLFYCFFLISFKITNQLIIIIIFFIIVFYNCAIANLNLQSEIKSASRGYKELKLALADKCYNYNYKTRNRLSKNAKKRGKELKLVFNAYSYKDPIFGTYFYS